MRTDPFVESDPQQSVDPQTEPRTVCETVCGCALAVFAVEQGFAK